MSFERQHQFGLHFSTHQQTVEEGIRRQVCNNTNVNNNMHNYGTICNDTDVINNMHNYGTICNDTNVNNNMHKYGPVCNIYCFFI